MEPEDNWPESVLSYQVGTLKTELRSSGLAPVPAEPFLWALPSLVSQDGNGHKQAGMWKWSPESRRQLLFNAEVEWINPSCGRSWNVVKHNLVNPRPLVRADVVHEEKIHRERVLESQTFHEAPNSRSSCLHLQFWDYRHATLH